MSQRLLERLRERFGDKIVETHSQHGDDTAIVATDAWVEVARFLRDDPRADMRLFLDLCAVDYPHREPRFEVVAHLYSLSLRHRLRLKARVGDVDGDGAVLDTLTGVWPAANWFERETFDLMGIEFRGHPDLRRILLYPEFVGHPLRKDYPADKTQPLVPFRPGYDKLPPFDSFEGMSFGRQVFRTGKAEN